MSRFIKKIINAAIVRVVITAIREGQGQTRRFDATGRTGEVFKDREFFQQYGLTSRPKADAEGVVIGSGNVFYLIASDDRRYRIALEDGEVALYTDEGDSIHLKRGNTIRVTTETLIVDAATKIELGAGAPYKLIDERLVTAFNSHTHPTAGTGAPSTPTTPLVLADVATAKTKAS